MVQHHMKALQPILQRLVNCACAPLDMEPIRQPHDVRKHALAERAKHPPLSARVDEVARFANRASEPLAEDIQANEECERDGGAGRFACEAIYNELEGYGAQRCENGRG